MAKRLSPLTVGLIVVGVFFLVIDTLAVYARVVAKQKVKRCIRTDDYWMFATLAVFYAWAILVIYQMIIVSDDFSLQPAWDSEIMFALRILVITTISCVKLSIISFYRSIFDCLRWFEIATYILDALCVAWFVMAFVATVILYQLPACQIFEWGRPDQNAACVSASYMSLVYRYSNPVIDALILALPMVVVRKLSHRSMREKLQVAAVFAMGGLVVVVCVAAILAGNLDPEQVHSVPYVFLWYFFELGIAILCGNLPLYRPLLPDADVVRDRLAKWYSATVSCLSGKTKIRRRSRDCQPSPLLRKEAQSPWPVPVLVPKQMHATASSAHDHSADGLV